VKLGKDGVFWRRLAHWGASRGPEWWVRFSPPLFGAAAAALVPRARRAALRNLRRARGDASRIEDARDVLATFTTFASCLAEVLSNDAAGGPRLPRATVFGDRHIQRAARDRRGLVVVTAHTAGWESAGPLLARDIGLPLVLVMQAEADAAAGAISDEARRRAGITIAHVRDPLGALSLLRHVRAGGVVALQIDRTAPGIRTRPVTLLGAPWGMPEGPLRLAQLTGAPILPVFCAREGYRRYTIHAHAPRWLDRRASEADLDAAAQAIADAASGFLRAHPTQWFHWT
jgi:KDO2-lipid IV(A) lauroyltransferase